MPQPTHVLVKAAPDRVVPFPESHGVGPNGLQLRATPDAIVRVAVDHFTRKHVGNGDLLLCDLNGAPVKSFDLAAAPMDIEAMREAATKVKGSPKAKAGES